MTRMPRSLLPVAGLLTLALGAGCALELGQSSARSEGGDDVGDGDGDECKIEDGDIGVVGLELDLGSTTVTFEDWVAKDGESGEYVGFTFSTSDGSSRDYLVKTGGEVYASSDFTWSHPHGLAGPDVPAVSHVDFPCDDPDGEDDGDGDGGDCNDPDGCDGGDGDIDPDGDGGECNDPDGCDGGDGGSGDDGGDDGDDGDCTDPDGCDDGDGSTDPYVE